MKPRLVVCLWLFIASVFTPASAGAIEDCELACDGVDDGCVLGASMAEILLAAEEEAVAATAVLMWEYILSQYCEKSCDEFAATCPAEIMCEELCSSADKVCDGTIAIGGIAKGTAAYAVLLKLVGTWLLSYACDTGCHVLCEAMAIHGAGGGVCLLAEAGDGECGQDGYGCPGTDTDCCRSFTCNAGLWCDLNVANGPYGICDTCDGCESIVCRSYSECVRLCINNQKDVGESGIDCGGPCKPCVAIPPPVTTCSDGVKSQGESGVDCGGPCPACPTCFDSVQNQGENGIDCGGPCSACATCSDGVQNQGEGGPDCGGPCAIPCCPAGDGDYCGSANLNQDPNHLYTCLDGIYTLASACGGLGCTVNDAGINDTCSSCLEGTTTLCYTGPVGTIGLGVCQAGTQVCTNGAWSVCQNEILPVATENCYTGIDNDCDGFIGCADADCAPLAWCQPDAALARLQNCMSAFPATTRVFTSLSSTNNTFDWQDPSDMNAYANAGCFIVDTAEDSSAPATEPQKTAFRLAFEANNPGGVLGRHSPFVEIGKSLADPLNLSEKAFVHCAGGGPRISTWFGLNYLLTPVTAEGQQAILDVTGIEAAAAIHPVLYFDSLLPDLWYFWSSNGGSCDLDIDGDGVADSLNDSRWVPKQLETLDLVRLYHKVGMVGHATDAPVACMFAPHLDGLDTELTTYVADSEGSRYGNARTPIAFLEAWELGARLCRGGVPCYRAGFTSADPTTDMALAAVGWPWEHPEIWDPGGLMEQMAADTDRINAAHVLSALMGGAALPGSTYDWGAGPFASSWIDANAGRPAGWLGSPIGSWKTLQSVAGHRIDAREYTNGLVLWNDGGADPANNPTSETVILGGWLGSSANLPSTGASGEGLLAPSVVLAPRSGAVLKRPTIGGVTLPPTWQDANIVAIPIQPGEDTQPLKVTLYYQPDATVASVDVLNAWASGFPWGPCTTNLNLAGPGVRQCDVTVGCIVTQFAAGADLTLVGDPSPQWSCYSSPPGSGQFAMRGTAWVETNHGEKVMLSCQKCDPPEDPLWCGNMQMPKGVLLK